MKAYFSRGIKEKSPEKAKLYKYIKACKDNFTPEQSAKYQDWESSYCQDVFNFVVAYFTENKAKLRLKGYVVCFDLKGYVTCMCIFSFSFS